MLRLLLVLSCVLGACAPRPTPLADPPADLGAAAGDWTGTLTYTDYRDDASRTTLPVTVTASTVTDPTFGAPALLFGIAYREPDGTPAGSDRAILTPLPDEPDTIGYDLERWHQLDGESSATGFSYTFEREGEDNDRPALIRHTITLDGDRLTNRKDVCYEGTDTFFERNTIDLMRTPSTNPSSS